MQYDMKKSGFNIRSIRIQEGYTQAELAKALNIDRSFLSCIESGKKGCSVDLLIQLSAFFHVSLDYLVFGSERDSRTEKEKLKEDITRMIDYLERFKNSL